jgi:hypothetical protein
VRPMHKMNGQSFSTQKMGLNARKGVKHYSVAESNIYWVRVWVGQDGVQPWLLPGTEDHQGMEITF